MSQTSYNTDQPVAFVGMKGRVEFDRVNTGLVETVAGIDFGLFVKPGTNAETQVDLVSAGAIIRGATLHRHLEKDISTGVSKYKQNMAADVLRQGTVWMLQAAGGGALAVDDPVYAMVDVAGQIGQATNAAGTNNILVPTAVVRKTAVDPDGLTIVLVEFNLP